MTGRNGTVRNDPATRLQTRPPRCARFRLRLGAGGGGHRVQCGSPAGVASATRCDPRPPGAARSRALPDDLEDALRIGAVGHGQGFPPLRNTTRAQQTAIQLESFQDQRSQAGRLGRVIRTGRVRQLAACFCDGMLSATCRYAACGASVPTPMATSMGSGQAIHARVARRSRRLLSTARSVSLPLRRLGSQKVEAGPAPSPTGS